MDMGYFVARLSQRECVATDGNACDGYAKPLDGAMLCLLCPLQNGVATAVLKAHSD